MGDLVILRPCPPGNSPKPPSWVAWLAVIPLGLLIGVLVAALVEHWG